MTSSTFGVIVGNRGFFPIELAQKGRLEIIEVLEEMGHKVIVLDEKETTYGTVGTRKEAEKCARLFRSHADEIDGIIVVLSNFGDEKSAADAIRLSGLRIPVLVQASPDDIHKMDMGQRRDSFCGKLSLCNNLTQYGIKFSLTRFHTCAITSNEFRNDIKWFSSVCRVVNGLSKARIGAIGTRPSDFNTMRYSEKILERQGISVETIDLSEILAEAQALENDDSDVLNITAEIKKYIDTFTNKVPDEKLSKMAKLFVVIKKWIDEKKLDAVAIQCWTSLEENYGVVPCTIMSLLSQKLLPAACEVDVTGALSMLALQLASGVPSGIVDLNNNYGEDPDKLVLFHCGNLPSYFFNGIVMGFHDILMKTIGLSNACGTVNSRLKPGEFTFARMSTNDLKGEICGYIGEGLITDEDEDPLNTFGCYGVAHVVKLQSLLTELCKKGFEHHCAISRSQVADVLNEALHNYLGWNIYYHK